VHRRGALKTLGVSLVALRTATGSRIAFAIDRLQFTDLYAGSGPLGLTFSATALRLRGRPVVMQGFMAPPLKADATFLVLTARPVSLCPFCQSDADWPHDIVVVYLAKGEEIERRASSQLIDVSGTLELGSKTDSETGFVSQVRLTDARARPV
jgi:hypothetical protein